MNAGPHAALRRQRRILLGAGVLGLAESTGWIVAWMQAGRPAPWYLAAAAAVTTAAVAASTWITRYIRQH